MAEPATPAADAPVKLTLADHAVQESRMGAPIVFGDEPDAGVLAMRGGELDVCVSVPEHEIATARCPGGRRIVGIAFASYGTPDGSCSRFRVGAGHANDSARIAERRCLGHESCSVPAENNVFGDPCEGTVKRLSMQVVCAR